MNQTTVEIVDLRFPHQVTRLLMTSNYLTQFSDSFTRRR
jgi:hypothetical protein